MRNGSRIALGLGVSFLCACSTLTDRPDEKPLALLVEDRGRCVAGIQEANTCADVDAATGRLKCHVFVIDKGSGAAVVYPYTLKVPNNEAKITIVWHIASSGHFRKGQDGAIFNDSDVSEADLSDEEGAPEPSLRPLNTSKNFKVTLTRRQLGNHDYKLQFRSAKENKAVSCDPRINNS